MYQLTEKEKAAAYKANTSKIMLNAEEERLVASALVKCVMNEIARHERKRKNSK